MKGLRLAGYAVAIIMVVFAVALASRFGSDPGLVQSPLLGEQAPGFELDTLYGDGTVRLDDLRGEIVVVNFFASWCPECRKEHDDLIATSDAFADQGVRFIQIVYQESPEAALRYLEEAGTSGSTFYLTDPRSRTALAYGVFGIPETYFIDRDGIMVGKIIGESNALVLGSTIDAIMRGEQPGQTITGDTQQRPEA